MHGQISWDSTRGFAPAESRVSSAVTQAIPLPECEFDKEFLADVTEVCESASQEVTRDTIAH
jgi:hypothetical protein